MSDFDYGLLAQLMQNEDVLQIYVNDPQHIYVWHKWEGYQAAELAFKDAADLTKYAHVLVSSVGQKLDAASPMIDLRLPDGSSATVMIAPVATKGAIIRISKAASEKFTMDRLVEIGAVSANAAKFLSACVKSRMNIAVVGGFNSSKTTFLNVLVDEIPEAARLVVIQAISALNINHADAVILESRKADIHGAGAINNRHLLEYVARLQPDRLILAELDGTEADLLLNTIDLGYTTMFSMSGAGARDALSRLESAVMSKNLSSPLLSIREQLARTIDVIVHVELYELGETALKRIVGISELRGMKGDTIDVVQLFERPRDHDELMALGEVSHLLENIRKLGRSEVDEAWFKA